MLYLLDETCSLVLHGGAGLGVFNYSGQVGEVYVFTDANATVAYEWVELQASNPDPVLIR